MRLVAVATHPIQYHAPLFRQLARPENVDLSVLFAHRPTPAEQGEGFGVEFHWDTDLTSGFDHAWLRNRSRRPSLTRFWGCNTPDVGRELRRQRADAVLVMGWNSLCYVQAVLAARRLGLPVLVRGDSHLETPRSRVKRVLKALVYPRWVGIFDACLAVGERSAEYFRHYGAREVIPSPHFVDNAWFAAAAAAADRAAVRRLYGVGANSFLFLFAGKLLAWKRPLDAIAALSECRAAGAEAELLIVGDGEVRAACERRARREGLPVRFAGFLNQSQMPGAYAAADGLVLPSEGNETWGLVVNEAMACGVPAIVSDRVGCAPDLVRSETGIVFPCGDVAALAGAMKSLVADRDHARRLGAQARKVVSRYSAERAAEGVIETLRVVGLEARAGWAWA